MRKFTIQIQSPCGEDWSQFTKRGDGRHCASCNKIVADFTGKSDREIMDHVLSAHGRVCARMRQDQQKHYEVSESLIIRPGFHLLKAGVISIVLLLLSRPTTASPIAPKAPIEIVPMTNHSDGQKELTVQGKILSREDGSPLHGVNVVVKGTVYGTITDADGNFKLNGVAEGATLVVSFIGYATTEHVITADASKVEIRLDVDLQSLGEVIVVAGELSVNEVYSRPGSRVGNWLRKVKNLF